MNIHYVAGRFAAKYEMRKYKNVKHTIAVARGAYFQAKPGHRLIAMSSAIDAHAKRSAHAA